MSTISYGSLIIQVVTTGSNGAGYCTATGVQVGDVLVNFYDQSNPNQTQGAIFSPAVSTADSIYQASGGNLSGNTYVMTFVRI
jgi:hypothetical protein